VFVERSGRLHLLRKDTIVVRPVHDASRMRSLRQVHQVQTVVRLKPEIRDEQVGCPGE
jgi:hypothetical protein